MADKYSAEWVRDQVKAKSARNLPLHQCSLCNEWVGYQFNDAFGPLYDSSCGCKSEPPRRKSYQDVADMLAMQSSDEIRDRIMSRLA